MKNHPKEQKVFSLDDLIEVWYQGCFNGASLWQYCQDSNYTIPDQFQEGMNKLREQIRKDGVITLQTLALNSLILLGTFDNLINTSSKKVKE